MNQTSYDVIVTVIASRGKIYDQLIEKYWVPMIRFVKLHYPSIHIIMMFGKHETTSGLTLKDKNIFYGTKPDSLVPGIYDKTVECFKHIENSFQYKHILRTNVSSFFIIEHLLKYSKSLGNSNIYAGFIGIHLNISFCSGSGFWLSPDIVKQLICNEHHEDRNTFPDDVAISRILKYVPRTKLPRFDLVNDIDIKDKDKLLIYISQKGMYHIRIKNSKNRQLDIDYVQSFTKNLYPIN